MLRKLIFIFCVSGLISGTAYAEQVVQAKVERLYVQSMIGQHKSDAHAVRINKPVAESCNGRLYIEPADNALFSTLLAYKASGVTFDLMYEPGSSSKHVVGHVQSTCKLYSIY